MSLLRVAPESEQRIFVDQFHMYLTYGQDSDFVIELDTVYNWIGFSKKWNAKALLLRPHSEVNAQRLRAEPVYGFLGVVHDAPICATSCETRCKFFATRRRLLSKCL
jgi:hypothetical protein